MVAKFLGGLSLEYYAAKINILTSDVIPSLFDAFNRLNRPTTLTSQSVTENNSSALAMANGKDMDISLEEGEVEKRSSSMYFLWSAEAP